MLYLAHRFGSSVSDKTVANIVFNMNATYKVTKCVDTKD